MATIHTAIIICGECNHHFPIGLGLASAVTCLACRVVIQIAEPAIPFVSRMQGKRLFIENQKRVECCDCPSPVVETHCANCFAGDVR